MTGRGLPVLTIMVARLSEGNRNRVRRSMCVRIIMSKSAWAGGDDGAVEVRCGQRARVGGKRFSDTKIQEMVTAN